MSAWTRDPAGPGRRKERLIARCAMQRASVRTQVAQLRGPIGWVDRGLEAARYLKSHPLQVGAAVAALMLFRGRGLIWMATRALTAWRLWSAVRVALARWGG